MKSNRLCKLFKIEFPIIQAGMVWCSGWKLASAVSNSGGLGLIGAGSMHPETLREHIVKCKAATDKTFGVNVPLLYPEIDKLIAVIIEEGVPVVFTSAGNPNTWTSTLKNAGIVVVHVVSSAKFALKAESAGVDAIVAEGFEAGGHNGREETTSMCLIPLVRDCVSIPLIAAGGIADGRSMLAAFALGAEAVQVGSRFAVTHESSAHPEYKRAVIESKEGDTMLALKKLTPVRLLKNNFFEEVKNAEEHCASKETLAQLLGKGRSKKGIFEGDLLQGELEVGQVSAQINDLESASTVFASIWKQFLNEKARIAMLR
jgi:enoyl-[acyl-carrier protein] reductase II